jgi:hypothetical protein
LAFPGNANLLIGALRFDFTTRVVAVAIAVEFVAAACFFQAGAFDIDSAFVAAD